MRYTLSTPGWLELQIMEEIRQERARLGLLGPASSNSESDMLQEEPVPLDRQPESHA